MTKTIIFDFFDVIRTDSYKGWLARRGQLLEGEYLEVNRKMDRGEIDVRGFMEHLSRLTGHSIEQIEEDMEAATKIDYDVLMLIETLRSKGYPIGLLSNAPSEFIRDIFAQHDLERYFDTIVISSEVGLIKPEPEIFHYILEEMSARPEEAVFVDDNPHNVKAAETLGIAGIIFKDALTLQKDLDSLGI